MSAQEKNVMVPSSESRDMLSFLETRNLLRFCPISDLCSGAVPLPLVPQEIVSGGKEKLMSVPMLTTLGAPRIEATRDGESVYMVAVDGNHMLSTLTQKLHEEAPGWFFEGPLPPKLLELLRNEVAQWRSKKMEPLFVFSGMAVHGDVESFVNTAEELDEREAAWEIVGRGERVPKELLHRAFDVVLGEDVEMAIMRFISHGLGAQVARAPFLQWAQMVAFLIPEHRRVNDVVGPPELLLFDHVSRVILDVDFERDMVTFVNKQDVLLDLFRKAYIENPRHGNALFLDLGLLTASHQSLTLLRPEIEATCIEMLYQEILAIDAHRNKVSDFVFSQFSTKQDANHQTWKLMKGRAFVRHCIVVLPKSGEVTSLSRLLLQKTKVPKNLVGVLGSRLPPFMYYLQFVGVLSVGSMTTISQNYIRDDNPVSDTMEYRECMEVVISLRTQILYQLVQHFQKHEDYRKRVKVSWIRWYEPISVSVLRPPDIRLDAWNLRELPDIDDVKLANVTFLNCMQYSTKGILGGDEPTVSEFASRNVHQLLVSVMLKSLDLLGYFTHITANRLNSDDDPITGPSIFADLLGTTPFPEHASPAVLLIELLRTRVLNAEPLRFIRRVIHPPAPWASLEHAAQVFASRVASLINVPTQPVPFVGPIDRDVVSFNVIVKNFNRTLRVLTEVICASTFLDGTSACDAEVFARIPALLPFQVPPNCVGGYLMRHLMTVCATVSDAEECWDTVRNTFPTLCDCRQAVADVILFWETAYTIMIQLHERSRETVCIAEAVLAVAKSANERIDRVKLLMFSP